MNSIVIYIMYNSIYSMNILIIHIKGFGFYKLLFPS